MLVPAKDDRYTFNSNSMISFDVAPTFDDEAEGAVDEPMNPLRILDQFLSFSKSATLSNAILGYRELTDLFLDCIMCADACECEPMLDETEEEMTEDERLRLQLLWTAVAGRL